MSTHACRHEGRCLIPPAPELREKIKYEVERLNAEAELIGPMVKVSEQKRPGFNDGLILPGDQFPLGTSLERVRSEAAVRAPLRGAVRVVVVLVDFDDRPLDAMHNAHHMTQRGRPAPRSPITGRLTCPRQVPLTGSVSH